MKTTKKNNIKSVAIIIAILILLNFIGNSFFHRFDLTSDKRYTLSTTSLNIIKQVENPLYIKVYMQGNLPAEFKRLQNETKQLL